jgi:hypothetical protein
MKLPIMSHFGIGTAQLIITVLFIVGFFGCAYMEGLGWFKISITSTLRDALVLVLSFWFMRQRTSAEKSQEDISRDPTLPASTPANSTLPGVTRQ